MSANPYLVQSLNRQLVKYAVSRLITCPHCGDILDQASTVVLTHGDFASAAMCAECYGHPIGSFRAGAVEVLDGRALFGRLTKKQWQYRAQ
jgi:hypothetical protein